MPKSAEIIKIERFAFCLFVVWFVFVCILAFHSWSLKSENIKLTNEVKRLSSVSFSE
jgi:hypothetical protein